MRMRLASRTRRLVAQALDTVIVPIPVFVVAVFAAGYTWGILLIATAFLVSAAYYFFADAMEGGQSFGKRLMGIAVLDPRTRRPCQPSQSFFRNLFLVLLGPIDWLFIFRPSRQRLGDWFANTVVVEVPRAAPPLSQRRQGPPDPPGA